MTTTADALLRALQEQARRNQAALLRVARATQPLPVMVIDADGAHHGLLGHDDGLTLLD